MEKSIEPLLVPRHPTAGTGSQITCAEKTTYRRHCELQEGCKAKFPYYWAPFSYQLFISWIAIAPEGNETYGRLLNITWWSESTQPRQLGHIPQVLAFSVPQLIKPQLRAGKLGLISNNNTCFRMTSSVPNQLFFLKLMIVLRKQCLCSLGSWWWWWWCPLKGWLWTEASSIDVASWICLRKETFLLNEMISAFGKELF